MPKFKEVSFERYNEMLGMLPPIWDSKGFQVGEPSNHRICRVSDQVKPTYMAFADSDGRFFESCEPMTVAEFRKMAMEDIFVRLET